MPFLEMPALPPQARSGTASSPARTISPGTRNRRTILKPARISFGGTAAIVTSMALISGLSAPGESRASLIGALLIAAVADNLTDSLSVHMYQESERLEQREVFIGTLTNFGTRLA